MKDEERQKLPGRVSQLRQTRSSVGVQLISYGQAVVGQAVVGFGLCQVVSRFLLVRGNARAGVHRPVGSGSESSLYNKEAMTRYPVLRQCDIDKPIHVVTDASATAIGGCLHQYHKDPTTGEEHPCAVAYVSRRMIPAERNYSVQEIETLAIVYTLTKFRAYLLATPFKIKCLSDHSDHQSLRLLNF
eukprot:SAG22_NODE_25_length_30107_cov_28.456412_14_plen_187_part_00